MTEQEWLTSGEWVRLWHFDRPERQPERKLRLFAVAACRRVAHRLTDPRCVRALEVCERDADHWVGPEEYLGAFAAARLVTDWDAVRAMPAVTWAAANAAYWLCHPEWYKVGRAVDAAPAVDGYEAVIAAGLLDPAAPPDVHALSMHSARRNGAVFSSDQGLIWQHEVFRRGEALGERAQADLLRDIYGNPFRPVAFDPAWRTDTAVSLARGMYEARDFAAMPVLADALQDAGCEDEQVLAHCRDPEQVHVRGCWVVDLVLGKA